MNCIRCQATVNQDNGYETESGEFVHHGCAMLMDEMPRRKTTLTLADMIAAKKKVDAANARIEKRNRGG